MSHLTLVNNSKRQRVEIWQHDIALAYANYELLKADKPLALDDSKLWDLLKAFYETLNPEELVCEDSNLKDRELLEN